MSGNGEDGAYPLQIEIEAEVGVFVECAGTPGEILEFGHGNFVYECAQCLLEGAMSCERYVSKVCWGCCELVYRPMIPMTVSLEYHKKYARYPVLLARAASTCPS